jgi:c(7)-type cytochrome triheme protein
MKNITGREDIRYWVRYRHILFLIYFSLGVVSCKTAPVDRTPPPELRSPVPAPQQAPPRDPTPAPTGTPPPSGPATPAREVAPHGPAAEGPASEPAVKTAGPTAPRAAPEATRTAPNRVAARAPEPRRAPPPRPRLQVTDRDPIHDPTNPAYARLQKPSDALHDMPLDRVGRVNWVLALERGLVAPRASVDGKARMRVLEGDVVMTDTRSMPHVRFPHGAHTEWLSCDSCHPQPFVAAENANPINMEEIFKGRYCGVCHDKVAFSSFVCERCHSIPHPGSPAKWW